jgi:transposase InsO family protein
MLQPIMADLPRDRIEPARAFLKCGVDFAGPFLLKTGIRRNAPLIKGYACIFVCFTTKAVHIELVSGLSTKDFLQALNRFFDRRGICQTIYSDNATNFVGANRHLKEIYELFWSTNHQQRLQEALTPKRIEWKFIPPRSPHFGGLWESSVKSMKNLMFKVLGQSHLTFEEMYSVLTRVEACLNSRPLTPLSSCPTDLAIPEGDLTNTHTNRLDRWRRVQQFSQHLWKRWSQEYLSQLQVRYKWANEERPKLVVGSIVLIREESISPLCWKLGLVQRVLPGSDGVVRSAWIKTASGELHRASRNLCILPFSGNK